MSLENVAMREARAAYFVLSACSCVPRGASVSCSCPWPSQAGMLLDGIARLGKCGTMVPAVTISPSLNFVRAKSLASVSVSNVLVDRGLRRRTKVPRLGISKETYQVYRISHPNLQFIVVSASVKLRSLPESVQQAQSDKASPGYFYRRRPQE
jgi:hypothetical protein